MVRFLHTADWQLGMTRHFLDAEAQGRYSEARLDALRRCGAAAVAHGCAFMVVGGDVFESNRLGRQAVARALETMGGLGVDVHLLPGNHDPLNAGSVWTTPAFATRPPNVHLLDEPVRLAVGDEAVQLVPAVWRTKHPLSDLVDDALRALPAPDGVRIVVGHGVVDRLDPDAANPAAIALDRLDARIRDGAVHYVALGDRHSATDVGTTGRVRYSGTPLVTDYDETAPNRALVVDVTPGAIDVTEVPVGDWRFAAQHFVLLDGMDVGGVERWLAEQPDKSRTVLKLSFVGTVNLEGRARLDEALEHARDLFAAVEVWERRTDLRVLPDDGDLASLGLTGFALEAAEQLRVLAAGGGDGGRTAQDALALLFRLGTSR